MKDDEYKGYYCLLIAILCNLNAAEASTMYEYGPDHPLCRKPEKRKSKPSIKSSRNQKWQQAMKALLVRDTARMQYRKHFSVFHLRSGAE